MDEELLRRECLQLAAMGNNGHEAAYIVEVAEQFFRFVKAGAPE